MRIFKILIVLVIVGVIVYYYYTKQQKQIGAAAKASLISAFQKKLNEAVGGRLASRTSERVYDNPPLTGVWDTPTKERAAAYAKKYMGYDDAKAEKLKALSDLTENNEVYIDIMKRTNFNTEYSSSDTTPRR